MIAYIEGVGWYIQNEIRIDWRGKRHWRGLKLPLRKELVYVNEKTYYVGAQCAANKKRREKHEE